MTRWPRLARSSASTRNCCVLMKAAFSAASAFAFASRSARARASAASRAAAIGSLETGGVLAGARDTGSEGRSIFGGALKICVKSRSSPPPDAGFGGGFEGVARGALAEVLGERAKSRPVRVLVVPGGIGIATRLPDDPFHDPADERVVAGVEQGVHQQPQLQVPLGELRAALLAQLERLDEAHEQAGIAEPDLRRGEPEPAHRLKRQRHDLGVGMVAILDPVELDAGLDELARRALGGAIAEHRSEIAVARRPLRARAGEMVPAHRNRVVGPQAQLAPGRVLDQVKPPADVLAGELQEYRGRLQDRRLDALQPPLGEQRDVCADHRVDLILHDAQLALAGGGLGLRAHRRAVRLHEIELREVAGVEVDHRPSRIDAMFNATNGFVSMSAYWPRCRSSTSASDRSASCRALTRRPGGSSRSWQFPSSQDNSSRSFHSQY